MNATHTSTSIDRQRAAITARSVLANLDLLTDQGLGADRRRDAGELAQSLRGPRHQLDDGDAATRAGELRGLLAGLPGPTAAVLVAWFDDALGLVPRSGARYTAPATTAAAAAATA